MSNILEALRKAQDEKSRVADQATTGREALIAHRTRRSWAGVNKRIIWLGCSGVILFVVVGWLLYGPTKPASAPKSNMAASTANIPAEPPLPPQQAPPPQPAPSPAVQAPAAVPAPPQANNDEESSPRLKNRPAPAAAPGQAAQPLHSQETVVSSVPDGVKLTGIAWQDSRKMRRAVINDVLVGEGTIVAGAKVLEIRPSFVRFEKNGTLFEATLPR